MIFFSIIALLLSLGNIAIILFFGIKLKRNYSERGFLIVLLLLWKQLMYYLPVNVYDVIDGYYYWNLYSIDGINFVGIYIFELISNSIFLAVLTISHRRVKSYVHVSDGFVLVLLLLLLIFNAFEIIENVSFGSFMNPLKLFSSFATFYLQPVALFSLIFIKTFRKRFWPLIALTSMSVLLSINTRGFIVYSALIFVSLVIFNNPEKITSYLLKSTVVFGLGIVAAGGVPQLSLSVDKSDSINRGAVSLATYNNHEKMSNRNLFQEIDFRFGMMPRMSSKFFELTYRTGHVGFMPFWNSLMGVIPRSIWSEKPIPSTYTGTDITDQAMYLIYEESMGRPSSSMVEFSVAGHYFWELNVIGVILLSVVSALYSKMVLVITSNSVLGLSAVISTMKPWGFMDPKIWISDIPLQIYQVFIPLALCYLLFKVVQIILRNFLVIFRNV